MLYCLFGVSFVFDITFLSREFAGTIIFFLNSINFELFRIVQGEIQKKCQGTDVLHLHHWFPWQHGKKRIDWGLMCSDF